MCGGLGVCLGCAGCLQRDLLSPCAPSSSPRPLCSPGLGVRGPFPPMQPLRPAPLRQPVNVAGAGFPARAAVDGAGGGGGGAGGDGACGGLEGLRRPPCFWDRV